MLIPPCRIFAFKSAAFIFMMLRRVLLMLRCRQPAGDWLIARYSYVCPRATLRLTPFIFRWCHTADARLPDCHYYFIFRLLPPFPPFIRYAITSLSLPLPDAAARYWWFFFAFALLPHSPLPDAFFAVFADFPPLSLRFRLRWYFRFSPFSLRLFRWYYCHCPSFFIIGFFAIRLLLSLCLSCFSICFHIICCYFCLFTVLHEIIFACFASFFALWCLPRRCPYLLLFSFDIRHARYAPCKSVCCCFAVYSLFFYKMHILFGAIVYHIRDVADLQSHDAHAECHCATRAVRYILPIYFELLRHASRAMFCRRVMLILFFYADALFISLMFWFHYAIMLFHSYLRSLSALFIILSPLLLRCCCLRAIFSLCRLLICYHCDIFHYACLLSFVLLFCFDAHDASSSW